MRSDTRRGLTAVGLLVGMGTLLVTIWWLVPAGLETPLRYTVIVGAVVLLWLHRRRKGPVAPVDGDATRSPSAIKDR
jgi:hypothetical protein